MTERSAECSLLDQFPGLRQLVESRPGFVDWSGGLPVVEVDGETFYVVRGDQLMDRCQVIVEWVRLYEPALLEAKTENGDDQEA